MATIAVHSTLHSLCRFSLAPTFLDVSAKNIQRTVLPTGKIEITITIAQQLFTTLRVFDYQQAAKHASTTTSRACSRRLREHTADEAPNKRAAYTPQQIVGIGAPSLLSILRPAALDVSPNWLTYSCTNLFARFCLNGATLHLQALLPSGIDITGS